MPKKPLTKEEICERLEKLFGDKIKINMNTYKNTSEKCEFIDKEFGSFWAIPRGVLRGHCGKKRGRLAAKQTNMEKYGCEYPSQNKEVREKVKQTNIERYGCESPSQNKEIKEKKKQTNIEKYGCENQFQNEEVKEKIKQTNLKKYGCEYPSQNEEIMEKKKQTNIEKYGCDFPFQSKGVKEKIKQTNLEKYGYENPSQREEIKEKKKQMSLEKYGCECTLQGGEIKDKVKQTNLKNLGVEYPAQNREVALKQARSSNKSTILYHWKTNEELICTASYEVKIVNYLNANKTEYEWQSKVFTMPNGKTYRPDLFLIMENKWVEIKGYFREGAKIKWEWFHQTHPNSELWDRNKLKEMKIL